MRLKILYFIYSLCHSMNRIYMYVYKIFDRQAHCSKKGQHFKQINLVSSFPPEVN